MHNQLSFNGIKQIKLILFVLLGLTFSLYGQKENFNEQDFFNRIKTSYYTLADTELENFVALVSSKKVEIFAQEMWQNPEIFPIQWIWFNPDKIYLSQQGVPKIEGDKYQEYQELVDGLKLQMRGILLDLQRFYLKGLYESINPDYNLQFNEEAVQINFDTRDERTLTKVKYLFGYNGLLILIQLHYPEEQKQIVIYPKFKIAKDKWLCTGWSVQTYVLNEITSGFNVTLKSNFINEVWVPGEILIEVQKSDNKGQQFYDEIRLRNYMFNQPIQIQKGTN